MSSSPRSMKDALFEQFARIGTAVSAPKRIELLDLLGQGPKTVQGLAKEAAMSVANASQHLQILRASRLVIAGKKGLFVEYRLADDEVGHFFVALRGLAQARLAEVDLIARAYLERRDDMAPIGAAELRRRVKGGDVTLIDVRPTEEYAAGHIPGALSVPLSQLTARLAGLPRRREVVAYCRGPYCVMAVEAVELLRKGGFKARRMEEGVVDWKGRGFRVATGHESAGNKAIAKGTGQ